MAKTKGAAPSAHQMRSVRFLAPVGSPELYARVAALERIPVDAWIRIALHKEAVRALDAHGQPTADLPPPHASRPPRLQPRWVPEDEDER